MHRQIHHGERNATLNFQAYLTNYLSQEFGYVQPLKQPRGTKFDLYLQGQSQGYIVNSLISAYLANIGYSDLSSTCLSTKLAMGKKM